MNPQQWVTILGALGTLAASVAGVVSALTRKDIRKQGVPPNGRNFVTMFSDLASDVRDVATKLDAHIAANTHEPAPPVAPTTTVVLPGPVVLPDGPPVVLPDGPPSSAPPSSPSSSSSDSPAPIVQTSAEPAAPPSSAAPPPTA